MVIAIDGPAGSGKSITAKEVARRLGFLYIDTGAMYRAVGLACLKATLNPEKVLDLPDLSGLRIDLVHSDQALSVLLNDSDVTEEIRSPEAGLAASVVAQFGGVRDKLVSEQRRIAATRARTGGVVLEGRDIGTVVFPDADVKIFLVAAPEIRAKRRFDELCAGGLIVEYSDVLAQLSERDRLDRGRVIAPLRQAEDAVQLDTSDKTIEEQIQFVLQLVKERQKHTTV